MHDLQCAKRADLGTDSAARTILFYGKIRIDQFKSAFWADRYAAPAISTNIPVYVEHFSEYVGWHFH
jgi:hypothetical protein